mgnify:CR=1 FL=1
MLHLHDIESGYGAGQVLFGVSLSVPAGRVVSLMGRNGMGKTTTIRTIMGQLPLTAGRILRFGNDQPDQSPFQIARAGIGLVPEGRQIFSNLDVTENLKTFYRPPRDGGGSHWHYERVLDLFPRLAERRDHAGNHLSGGEQQMLAVARALARDIKLLLLDEPYEGLAPVIVREIEGILKSIKKLGITTIIVEQNAVAALRVADRALILDTGEIVFDGTAQELLDNKELRHQYLAI